MQTLTEMDTAIAEVEAKLAALPKGAKAARKELEGVRERLLMLVQQETTGATNAWRVP